MVTQPTQALTEFVKHVADPLVDKGWNLHLKFGKGGPQKEEFIQGTTTPKTSTKAADKEKVCGPPQEKQVPLEMGTGGGGGGRKGGGGGKRPLEDKSEFENYLKKDDDDDDTDTETSFELEVAPEQLASINPNRPILRLKLSPRKRVVAAAPGGGGTPPPGSATETQPPAEGPGHGRSVQPLGGGGRPPQPPGGGGVESGGPSWPPQSGG